MQTTYDVVIIGGGIAGSATAFFLSAEPHFQGSILVVEKDSTYEFCAAVRSSGGVRQQWGTPENVTMGLFGAHFIKHVNAYLSVDGMRLSSVFMSAAICSWRTRQISPISPRNMRCNAPTVPTHSFSAAQSSSPAFPG